MLTTEESFNELRKKTRQSVTLLQSASRELRADYELISSEVFEFSVERKALLKLLNDLTEFRSDGNVCYDSDAPVWGGLNECMEELIASERQLLSDIEARFKSDIEGKTYALMTELSYHVKIAIERLNSFCQYADCERRAS